MTDNSMHKECQDCKKVFLLPKSSRLFNEHSCPFCGSWNTAYISQKQYIQSQNRNFIR